MSDLYPNYSSYWNPDGQRISESLSKSLSLKLDSSPQLRLNAGNLGFQLQDQDSSSSQSTQSNHDLAATAGTNSQDQCMSSESGQEVTGGKNAGGVKPVYMMGQGQPDSTAHIDYGRSLTCMPYPCGDPYFSGLLAAYGQPPVIQPQMMGLTSARVPLPLDMTEDEPIYVNAKQYHGILRRRQSRAKLEAQNKLIKARKPYLHESRHLHALNRVRGSGGRFLSTKKQQSESTSLNNGNHRSNLGSNPFGHNSANLLGFESRHQSQYVDSRTSNMSGRSSFYQQAANGSFLGISSGGAMQRNGGFMKGSNQHCASVVR